jgi:hypothetical protein
LYVYPALVSFSLADCFIFKGKWILVEGDNGKGIPQFGVFADAAVDKWIP